MSPQGKNLDLRITEIKTLGNILVNYNFPQKSKKDEEVLNELKISSIYLDGYDLIVHYNKAFYGKLYIESLQVLGKYTLFLPFSVVCKIAKKFFGDKHLSFIDVFIENRRVYCWTLLTDLEGIPIPPPYEEENLNNCEFEG